MLHGKLIACNCIWGIELGLKKKGGVEFGVHKKSFIFINTLRRKEHMKKIVFVLFASAVLLLGSNAFAFSYKGINSYFDLNVVAQADSGASNNYFTADRGDGKTEAIKELTYYSKTKSVIDVRTGEIRDRGMLVTTGLNFVSGDKPGDNEQHGNSWAMTITWDNLVGRVTKTDPDGTLHSVYTGGTFNVYIDYNPYGVNMNDVDDFSSLVDGYKVAEINITGGSNTLVPEGQTGSSFEMYGEFTNILDDFWFNADTGVALEDHTGFDLGWIVAYTHGDTDPNNVRQYWSKLGTELTVVSEHDSSLSLGAVPEPTTLALFGLGLLGAAGFVRRKS